MSSEKLNIIRNSTNEYKKLPKDKQMFILGYMQGVLSNHNDIQEKTDNCVSESDTGRR